MTDLQIRHSVATVTHLVRHDAKTFGFDLSTVVTAPGTQEIKTRMAQVIAPCPGNWSPKEKMSEI